MPTYWRYSRWQSAPAIEIGQLEAAAPLPLAWHFHRELQVAVVAEGWRLFSTQAGMFRAMPGDIVVIPARMPHASYASSASAVTHLYIEEDHPAVRGITVPQIAQSERARSPGEVIELIGSMRRSEGSEKRPATPASWPEQVLQGWDTVGALANHLGYSSDGFIRAFKREVGMTPAAYRLAHRLACARLHLKTGCTAVDAAYLGAFADQSHFGRLFVKAYGATPAAYRRAFTAA
jgi:AraC-like DNA-binding protein